MNKAYLVDNLTNMLINTIFEDDKSFQSHVYKYIGYDLKLRHYISNINKNYNIENMVKISFKELNIIRHILGRRLLYNKSISELCFKLACQKLIKLLNYY